MICFRNVTSEDQARVWWQTVPRPPCSHRIKGAVASLTSGRHLQAVSWCQQSGDSDQQAAISDSDVGRMQAVRQTRRCCAVHTIVLQSTQPELDSLRDTQPVKLPYIAVELCVRLCRLARVDEPSGGIQHGLQSVLQVYRNTHKDLTLIPLSDD